MSINSGIRQQLLAASLAVSLLQPFALGSVGSLLLGAAAGEVRAQQTLNSEAIGRIAQAITVRIEGATQGSGVLVKREGNRYTVLTAWHVVSGQRSGEELDIFTIDGIKHAAVPASIKQIGGLDMATITFESPNSYQLASISDSNHLGAGSLIYLSAYPAGIKFGQSRAWRFLEARLSQNSVNSSLPHTLFYTVSSDTGMSGGGVFDSHGHLVAIHVQAEIDIRASERFGVAVKTGTGMGLAVASLASRLHGVTIFSRPVQLSSRSGDDTMGFPSWDEMQRMYRDPSWWEFDEIKETTPKSYYRLTFRSSQGEKTSLSLICTGRLVEDVMITELSGSRDAIELWRTQLGDVDTCKSQNGVRILFKSTSESAYVFESPSYYQIDVNAMIDASRWRAARRLIDLKKVTWVDSDGIEKSIEYLQTHPKPSDDLTSLLDLLQELRGEGVAGP